MEARRPPPLKSTDSTTSLGSSTRPPLVWLFNHFRQEGKTSLCKEDLQRLVGPQVDPVQLDQAFDNLDADGDGEVSMEEFVAGFARFWRETPDTPSHKLYDFNFSPSHSMNSSSLVTTGRQQPLEEHYEYGGQEEDLGEEGGPDEQFQRTLGVLSSHNRHSMEQLWRSLKEANPELLTDFEDFVAEVASEVEGAQRALDNQRRANKKEAMELDNEIESRLSAAQTTLHIQTSLVRQEEKTKLERRLKSKESELFSVRNQLQELESEIVETQQNRLDLEQHCQDLQKEKQELKERLEVSERKLQIATPQENEGVKIEQLELQEKLQNHQEEELLQEKKKYEEEILKLRKELEMYSKQVGTAEDEEVESLLKRGVARPDLLATTRYLADTGSLMQEIAAKEGMASPLLRREQVLLPSPFQRTRAGSMRKGRPPPSNLKSRAALSLSLPNLADVDSLESLEAPQLPSHQFTTILHPSQRDSSSSSSSTPSPPPAATPPSPSEPPIISSETQQPHTSVAESKDDHTLVTNDPLTSSDDYKVNCQVIA